MGEKAKDLSEVLPEAPSMEGEKKHPDELLGTPITIDAFGMRPSRVSEGEYASVQAHLDGGEKVWFNSGSGPVMETLGKIKDSLPIRCVMSKHTSDKGFDYYSLNSAEAPVDNEKKPKEEK